ncbi:MAG: acyl-CoA thioesterase [Pirellulales bacterium]|nr:acyl-CoA thioesterase [Pirellulales bacterium]
MFRMDDPFRYYLRVRYGECDAQKIVFNAQYGVYVDLAGLEFLRALGYGEVLMNGPLDYQVVKQTTQWKSSARFDDVLQIAVEATALGTTSFTLACQIHVAGRPEPIATTESVYVLVDAKTLEKTPLPADFRAALQSGAPGRHVNHADSTLRHGAPEAQLNSSRDHSEYPRQDSNLRPTV